MNHKVRNGLIALFAVAVVAIGIVWFFSPGIHTCLFWTRIDQSGNCYVLDAVSDEMILESAYQIEGIASPLFKTFKGEICVEAYPNEGEPTKAGGGTAWYDNGDLCVHYRDVRYGEPYTIVKYGKQYTKRDMVYQIYAIYLTGDKKRDIVIQIPGELSKTGVVVCADSLEEAKQILELWLQQ